jgi:hypothetical protein
VEHPGRLASKTCRRERLISKRPGSFDEEIEGASVRVVLHDGRPIVGRVVEARRHWLKVATGGSVVYVNKAYIAYIQPQQPKLGA